MKVKEIRNMSSEELIKKADDLKGELFNLRFRLATGQLDNPQSIKMVKKTLQELKLSLEKDNSKKERR